MHVHVRRSRKRSRLRDERARLKNCMMNALAIKKSRALLRLVRACACTDLFENFFVIKSFLMNLSLQFYEDPCFCLGDIQLLVKVEVYGLMIEKYPKINPPEMHLFW